MPTIRWAYGSSGPIIDVLVGISEPRRRFLLSRGLPVPPALPLPFIIDTGAETTMVNEQHMRTLGIEPRGFRQILTSTSDQGPTRCNTYDISIKIPTFGDEPFFVPAVEALGRPLFNHSIDGMIGRDLLARVTLTVEGPARRFRLDY